MPQLLEVPRGILTRVIIEWKMPMGTADAMSQKNPGKFQYQKYPWGLSTWMIIKWKMHCAFFDTGYF